jgi:hypothetical protein
MADELTNALNSPAGRLVGAVIAQLKGSPDQARLDRAQLRLNTAFDSVGEAGFLARVRMAADLSFLFYRLPEWTTSKLVPIFDWSGVEAGAAWSARRYSPTIGPPTLFKLTKKPFLDLFGQSGFPAEAVRIFAEWLIIILLQNAQGAGPYELSFAEVRFALRRAGPQSLANVAHRLGLEMERVAKDKKSVFWLNVIGPIFDGVWPLDTDLQTVKANFSLVKLVLAAGEAFTLAVDAVSPFIQSEKSQEGTSLFLLSQAPNELYELHPKRMLNLLSLLVGSSPGGDIYHLRIALSRIDKAAPDLVQTKQYQRLAAATGS